RLLRDGTRQRRLLRCGSRYDRLRPGRNGKQRVRGRRGGDRLRPDERWIEFRLENHRSRRTAQRDLARSDAFDTPIVDCLALGTGLRLAAGHREDGKAAFGLEDDPRQPYIQQLRLGSPGAPSGVRRAAGRVEQRLGESRLHQLLDRWPLRCGRCGGFGPRRARHDDRPLSRRNELGQQQRTEHRAPRQKNKNKPIHHCWVGEGASTPRNPYTSKAASRRALAGSPPPIGRTIEWICRLLKTRGGAALSTAPSRFAIAAYGPLTAKRRPIRRNAPRLSAGIASLLPIDAPVEPANFSSRLCRLAAAIASLLPSSVMSRVLARAFNSESWPCNSG